MSPINPTAYVNIDRASSSSGTLQEQDALQYSSYGGVVSVDLASSNTGIEYPVGNMQYPVNNFDDAVDIGDEKGFAILSIRGDGNITEVDILDNFIIQGQNKSLTTITIDDDASVDDCTYLDATIIGTLDGESTLEDCRLGVLFYVSGDIQHCEFTNGRITLGGTEQATFDNCFSAVAGSDTPELDVGTG